MNALCRGLVLVDELDLILRPVPRRRPPLDTAETLCIAETRPLPGEPHTADEGLDGARV